MELGDLWKIGIGTILSLFALVGLFRFKNALRQRLFPTSERRERGEAMAELFALRARLQAEGEDPNTKGGGVADAVDDLGQEPRR